MEPQAEQQHKKLISIRKTRTISGDPEAAAELRRGSRDTGKGSVAHPSGAPPQEGLSSGVHNKDGMFRAARMARSLVSQWPLPPPMAVAVAVKSAPACPYSVRVALEAEVA